MSDDQVYQLLQEIRDLQKHQLEKSELSLSNQQLAIARMRRGKFVILIIFFSGLMAQYLLPVLWSAVRSALQH